MGNEEGPGEFILCLVKEGIGHGFLFTWMWTLEHSLQGQNLSASSPCVPEAGDLLGKKSPGWFFMTVTI